MPSRIQSILGATAIALLLVASSRTVHAQQPDAGAPPTGTTVQLVLPADQFQALKDLENRRVTVEEQRLKADNERAAAATADKGDKGPGLSPPFAGLLGVIITALFGLVLHFLKEHSEQKKLVEARALEREKMMTEVAFARSTRLAEGRMDKYTELWKRLQRLSMYPLPEGFTTEDAGIVLNELRQWYFDLGGGMFLSEERGSQPGSKARYFALQHALDQVVRLHKEETKLVIGTEVLTSADAKDDEKKKYAGFRQDTPLPKELSSFEKYRLIRAMGSLLRSAIVEDLGTRAAPEQPKPNLPAK